MVNPHSVDVLERDARVPSASLPSDGSGNAGAGTIQAALAPRSVTWNPHCPLGQLVHDAQAPSTLDEQPVCFLGRFGLRRRRGTAVEARGEQRIPVMDLADVPPGGRVDVHLVRAARVLVRVRHELRDCQDSVTDDVPGQAQVLEDTSENRAGFAGRVESAVGPAVHEAERADGALIIGRRTSCG